MIQIDTMASYILPVSAVSTLLNELTFCICYYTQACLDTDSNNFLA